MKATVLDLRRRMGDILKALERNESVTILYRGKEKGILYPVTRRPAPRRSPSKHPAFGMWKDREDLRDVEKAVRALRKGRPHAI